MSWLLSVIWWPSPRTSVQSIDVSSLSHSSLSGKIIQKVVKVSDVQFQNYDHFYFKVCQREFVSIQNKVLYLGSYWWADILVDVRAVEWGCAQEWEAYFLYISDWSD